MSLLTLQRDFGGWLREGDAAGAADGMRIHQNNYRASLTACLADSFPRTREWIGGAAFEAAMIRHIQRVPPSSWTLDVYGRDFPDTLAAIYPHDPDIAELAGLEWALAEAFVGPDADPIDARAAAAIDWEMAKLQFIPTIDLRTATTNAHAIWSALATGAMPPAAGACAGVAALLVWRQDYVARLRPLDAGEHHALLLARSGVTFAALCDALVEAHGPSAGVMMAGTYLGQWIRDGLLVAAS
ncbi:HvfC/BufC family peptide modification chaperone [Sphingomonas sp. ASY06-1R]|uniref:HvfC/BufC family peptide modification chaperone n=1 Tax=Sphingomonas sp. ASY06-1R TaxID=3445771 RepID=UPI003FA2BC93